MKIAIGSDFHIEFETTMPLSTPKGKKPLVGPSLDNLEGVDIVLLAGDIWKGEKSIDYAASVSDYLNVPVCLVHGNHEFYGGKLSDLRKMREKASLYENVRFLENKMAHFEFHGEAVRIIGCCLWTDFNLFGPEYQTLAMNEAGRTMNDYRKIRTDEYQNYRKLLPTDTLKIHQESRNSLGKKLSYDFNGKTIVMTHHGVSRKSVPSRYSNDLVSAAYSSDLESLIGYNDIDLWCHGHTHDELEYTIGDTKVICHPRGYPDFTNESYRMRVIEI